MKTVLNAAVTAALTVQYSAPYTDTGTNLPLFFVLSLRNSETRQPLIVGYKPVTVTKKKVIIAPVTNQIKFADDFFCCLGSW